VGFCPELTEAAARKTKEVTMGVDNPNRENKRYLPEQRPTRDYSDSPLHRGKPRMATEKDSLTKSVGQWKVGADFNPSGASSVNAIKTVCADAIDTINRFVDDKLGYGQPGDASCAVEYFKEVERLRSQAVDQIEMAAMLAVKAVTKSPR
jgi:hypothetical protein